MKVGRIFGNHFWRWLATVFFVFVVLLLNAGCSSVHEMALKPGATTLDIKKASVCLFSLKTENKFKPDWPPEVYGIEIINKETNEKIKIAVQSMATGTLLKKAFSDAFTVNKGSSSWEGLISFQLPPGSYHLSAIRGGCAKGIGIVVGMASFDFPFDIPFQVENGECVYMGRIEMTNRERVSDDEIPSGDNLITRLPQRHSGFGTGTFDVKIYDNFDQDIQRFKEKYPVLSNQVIKKRILPQWKKPENRS
ncbi:MAG: hypothetical protein AB1711_05380 [Thermodesulfobacteriota bacterium]